MVTWAGGLWLYPIGLLAWDVPWAREREFETWVVMDLFFWIMIIGLLVTTIVAYL